MHLNQQISKSFNRSAQDYERFAKVQREIGSRLFERLHYLKMVPQRILDLGCGTGLYSKELAKLFPKAEIVGVDLAFEMLLQAQKKQGWRRKWALTNADMMQLPFAEGAFDLIFANQVVHWADSLEGLFRELNRITKPQGCLMFSTLGPDTFKELRHAWASINPFAHVNEFADMHDVGDILMHEKFLEPVVDMELLTVHYSSVMDLVRGLKHQGVKNIHTSRPQGLTGKKAWSQFQTNYEEFKTANDKYPLTYEVVYGQAWKGEQRKTQRGTETLIPITQIQRAPPKSGI